MFDPGLGFAPGCYRGLYKRRTARRSGGLRRWLLVASVACVASVGSPAFAAGLTIESPRPGENLRDNRGNLTVILALEDGAELPRGFAFRLLLDGKPAAPDVAVKRIPLTNIDRGTHQLQALIVDGDGQELTRSPRVDFTVRQASRLNPGASP